MGVPIVYRSGGEEIIQSYNYTDIITGTGYVLLYAGKCLSGAYLSNIAFASEHANVATLGQKAGAGAATKQIDQDFDVLVNKPMTIQGKLIVNVSHRVWNSSSDGTMYLIARFRKWNGVTETEIAVSGNSNYINCTGGGAEDITIASLDMTIPLTLFKKGEYIRVTIEAWLTSTGAGATNGEIAHDATGRTTDFSPAWNANFSTILKVFLPVRLDL